MSSILFLAFIPLAIAVHFFRFPQPHPRTRNLVFGADRRNCGWRSNFLDLTGVLQGAFTRCPHGFGMSFVLALWCSLRDNAASMFVALGLIGDPSLLCAESREGLSTGKVLLEILGISTTI